jgi:hypothetical protein
VTIPAALQQLAIHRRTSGHACVARRLEDHARTAHTVLADAAGSVLGTVVADVVVLDVCRRALELVDVRLPRVVSPGRLQARRALDANHVACAALPPGSGIARANMGKDREALRQQLQSLEVADRQRENALVMELLSRAARGEP